MRRIVPLLALLPLVAVAQPTAADTALVERLLPALQLEVTQQAFDVMGEQMGALVEAETDGGPPPEWMADAFAGLFAMDLATTTDSIRAAFLRDLRPDLIAEALVYLEGPVPAAFLAESRFTPATMDMVEMAALLDDPSGEPLADSALSARFAAAQWAASAPEEATALATRAAIDAIPPEMSDVLDEVFEPLGGFEGFLAAQQAEQAAAQQEMMTLAFRLSLADVDEALIRDATAFYESDAGRYVSETVALAQARLMAPATGAMMRTLFEKMMDEVGPPPGPPPPPPPPADPDLEIFEVVDVQPTLKGGLAGLQRRVIYPEAARRRGIEGQVVVQFVVDEEGRVRYPVVLRSPDDLLSTAALDAVRGSRFTPGLQDGRAVKVRFAVPITFRLRSSAPSERDRGGW